jgi:predicted membrane protein
MAKDDYLITDLILFIIVAFVILLAIRNWFYTLIIVVIIYAMWKKYVRGKND